MTFSEYMEKRGFKVRTETTFSSLTVMIEREEVIKGDRVYAAIEMDYEPADEIIWERVATAAQEIWLQRVEDHTLQPLRSAIRSALEYANSSEIHWLTDSKTVTRYTLAKICEEIEAERERIAKRAMQQVETVNSNAKFLRSQICEDT